MDMDNGCWSQHHQGQRQHITSWKIKQQQQAESSIHALLSDLKSCSMRRDLHQGRRIHAKAVEGGNDKNIYIATALVNMYAKCGRMADAFFMFNSVQKPDVVCWNAVLLGYVENGNGLAALDMFSRMKGRGCRPDSVTYIGALKACTSLAVKENETGKENCLKRGREIHLEIGCHLDHYVQSRLIDMYAKCGSMLDARVVFDSVLEPDVVCWNVLLVGYADNGEGVAALEMFESMKAYGCTPSSVTYIAAFKACILLIDGNGKECCLKLGRELHSEIGCHLDRNVQSMLINMYAKCGSMVDARHVFNSVHNPNVVIWNSLLLGYAENGEELFCLDMFSRMKKSGCTPSSVTYMAVLKACGLIGALALGRKFHLEITEINAYLVTCLVDFYSKCASMVEARGVFDLHSKNRDASTWTALLAGYSSLGDSEAVFKLFEAMQDEGFRPNAITFSCMLSCCSRAGLTEKGRKCFETMSLQYGVTPSVMHYTCMVDILGRANQLNEAVGMIRKMPYHPNAVTWRTLLGACCKWKNMEIGRSVFQSLVDIDKKDPSIYTLMANIYGSVGMWKEQERVLEMRTQVGALKLPGKVYVMDEKGEMVRSP